MRGLRAVVALVLVVAACGDDGSATDRVEEAPSIEEFTAAEDCDALNALYVQADAAVFWEYADLTVDGVDDIQEGEGDFDTEAFEDIDRAFSDRQVELDCSDSSMMQAMETAIRERCEAWMETHSEDEEPLLINTLFCLGQLG